MLRTLACLALGVLMPMGAFTQPCAPLALSLTAADACDADTEAFGGFTLAVHATVEAPFDGLRSLTLTALDWPGSPGFPDGEIYLAWNADGFAGSLDTGLELSWDPPLELLPGSALLLGELEVLPMSDAWPGVDAPFALAGAFTDRNGLTQPALGANFTFNCSAGACGCQLAAPDLRLSLHDLAPLNGSSVLDGFPLSFTVESRDCAGDEDADFTGRVLVAGLAPQVFGGTGETFLQFAIGTEHVPPGGELAVTVLLNAGDESRRADLVYAVDEGVAIAPASWSEIKSNY